MTGGKGTKYQSPQPVTPVQSPLFILADDLTGASDAAVAFTSASHSVLIHINREPSINSEPSRTSRVQATTTESRDLPVADAEARIQNIVERLLSDIEFFKKVDSVFRGNTVAEIAATLRYAHYELAVLAPAYPTLGRTVHNGILQISDFAGNRSLPIANLLAGAGCSFTTLPVDCFPNDLVNILRRNLNHSKPAFLCDTASQHDLTLIVRAAQSLRRPVLWIGSGGLAHALAAELPPAEMQSASALRPGHTIFFIGTPHPVTSAQVEYLRRTTQIIQQGHATNPRTTDLLVPVVLGETTADEIRRAIAAHDPAQIGCLFMTGGDTAHFVCRALAINALRLQREFAPGVPLAIAVGGAFDGVSVVLKSGGFGEPDLLYRLLESYRPEVTA